MTLKSTRQTWKKSLSSSRLTALAPLTASLAAMATLYACTGDDTSVPLTSPPLNDAGPDTSMTMPMDSGGDVVTAQDGGPARACSSLPGTILYIESADTQEALLDKVGRELRDKSNVTIVFLLTGSCTVVPAIYGSGSGPVAIPANTQMLYIPSTAENPAWTPSMPESTCTTGTATPTPDLGIAALFPSSCASFTPPAGTTVTQFVGPTQAYTFIVPTGEFATQTSISAEEAYYAFGFGAQNPVTIGASQTHEWNIPTQFYLRPATKSTLVSTAINIHLTASQMTDALPDGGTGDGRILEASSTNVLTATVAASTNTPQEAIGILGDEVYDSARGTGVDVLAFQTFGQNHAYFPDSTQTSFDKQNIRDGHYTLWSPDVYLAPATAGVATNPTVQYLLDIILGNPGAIPPDGGVPIDDAIALTAGVGLTPSCAMQVTRSADGADLVANPRFSTAPCTCKFLASIPGATPSTLPASCTTCATTADCGDAAGVVGCFNGYCETAPTPYQADGGCDEATFGINACTNATAVDKVVNLPTADGGLLPPPL